MLVWQRLVTCVLQNIESLRIGLHQPVFDAVVNHLYEMSGAVRAGVDVALRRPRITSVPMRRRRDLPSPRGERTEDRIEPLDPLLVTADHQAVAALEPPHAAAR